MAPTLLPTPTWSAWTRDAEVTVINMNVARAAEDLSRRVGFVRGGSLREDLVLAVWDAPLQTGGRQAVFTLTPSTSEPGRWQLTEWDDAEGAQPFAYGHTVVDHPLDVLDLPVTRNEDEAWTTAYWFDESALQKVVFADGTTLTRTESRATNPEPYSRLVHKLKF